TQAVLAELVACPGSSRKPPSGPCIVFRYSKAPSSAAATRACASAPSRSAAARASTAAPVMSDSEAELQLVEPQLPSRRCWSSSDSAADLTAASVCGVPIALSGKIDQIVALFQPSVSPARWGKEPSGSCRERIVPIGSVPPKSLGEVQEASATKATRS